MKILGRVDPRHRVNFTILWLQNSAALKCGKNKYTLIFSYLATSSGSSLSFDRRCLDLCSHTNKNIYNHNVLGEIRILIPASQHRPRMLLYDDGYLYSSIMKSTCPGRVKYISRRMRLYVLIGSGGIDLGPNPPFPQDAHKGAAEHNNFDSILFFLVGLQIEMPRILLLFNDVCE